MKKNNKISMDNVFEQTTKVAAFSIILLLVAIFIAMTYQSSLSIQKFGFGFLFDKSWNPITKQFGALSSIYGTLVSTFIAMILAVPMSFFISFFLVEIAPDFISIPIGYAIELLAGIPSIVYGMWGLFVFVPFMAEYIQPFLQKYFGFLPIFKGVPMGIGMLSAGIILAIMILPFMTSIMRDVFLMIPKTMKEAAFGIGSTTFETSFKISVRYGIKGIIGALFLGLGRALGETMAVTFVIGNNHKLSTSLFDAGNTIASTLANEFAEASDPLFLSSLAELGLVLLVITFIVNGFAMLWLKNFSRKNGR